MHQPVLFCTLQDLIGFLFRNFTPYTSAYKIIGALVQLDAHILLQMAAALAHESSGAPACTVRHTQPPGFFYVGRYFLVIRGMAVPVDCLLDGYDTHQSFSNRNIWSEQFGPSAGIFLETLRHHRIFLCLLFVRNHHLHDSRNPDRQHVVVRPVCMVYTHHTCHGQIP